MNNLDVRLATRPPKVLQVLQELHQFSSAVMWDGLPVAIFICDADGRVVRFNRRAAEIWGYVPDITSELIRAGSVGVLFRLDGRPLCLDETPMNEVLRTGEPVRDRTLVLERPDRSRVTVLVNVDPVLDDEGRLIGAVNCFQDVSELRRMEGALNERDQRLTVTYEHVDLCIAETDESGKVVRVNEAMCRLTGYSRDELLGHTMYYRTHPDDVARDRLNYRQQVSGGYERYAIEKRFIKKDGSVIWISVMSSSVRDEAGNFLYGLRVIQDVTERRLADERQKALIDELNHRVKNIIATVRSLAAHTLREGELSDYARQNFDTRLLALARVHEQLTGSDWQSADLVALIGDIFAPYRGGANDVRLDGRSLRVQPQAAVTIALVLHELATNAVKYGAMSVPGGVLAISWRVDGVDEDASLTFDWMESGGPEVIRPDRRGFGSRLLDWGVAQQLQGTVDARFDPAGFRCRIDIPLGVVAA